MAKPTQEELDTTLETIEYLIANMEALEPFAVITIAEFNSVRMNIPCEAEIEEHE